MTLILELSDRELHITMINLLKLLIEQVNNMAEGHGYGGGKMLTL
jgi:hypothetical protein